MENASQALLMAGKVLIALMILGALVLTFNNLMGYQNTRVVDKRTDQTIEFNRQFETYDRDDVRGSDLYSLLNRAIDYNERKSSAGVEGVEHSFHPITIKISFKNKIERLKLSADGNNNLLFKSDKYSQDKTENALKDIISENIKLENKYGKDEIAKLASNLTRIFIDKNSGEAEKEAAVKEYNRVYNFKKISNFSEITEGSQIRKDIYKYYEFIQFKRAHFTCKSIDKSGESGVIYDKNSGRVIEMQFEFTGKIN